MGTWNIQGGQMWNGMNFIQNSSFFIQVRNAEDKTVRVDESSLVVPGLVDFHCHLFAKGADIGVLDSACLKNGVVACGDAGTFGYQGWETADATWQNSPVIIRSWLSVLPEGLTIHPNPNPTKPENISIDRLVATAKRADGRLLGFKIRLGQVDAKTDRGLLHVARNAADQTGLHVMVHLTGTELNLSEVTEYLRKSDVVTHLYHGKRGNVLDGNRISKSVIEAKDRGILFDLGHGGNHFTWRVFRQALSEGIIPDFISTDWTMNTLDKQPVYNLPHVISKLIAAGLKKELVFKAVLENAPQYMNIQIGDGNLLILDEDARDINYVDVEKEVILGSSQFVPRLQIVNGIAL